MAGNSESESNLTVILASVILDKIQKGEPIKYNSAIIVGDLDLDRLDLPTEHIDRTKNEIENLGLPTECKAVYSSITISKSEVKGTVNFSNILFKDSITFENTTFCGYAYFNGVTFNSFADFISTKFKRNAEFSGATFNGDATFISAKFNSNTDFEFSKFNSDAYFTGATFSDYTNFMDSKFRRNADLFRATFRGYANFWRAKFRRNARFTGATFSVNADFYGATFSGNAIFYGATFSEDALFKDAKFEKELDLTLTKYRRLFIRWKSITQPRHKWKLLENWNERCNIKYDDTTYLLLIDNLKSLGLFEDADNCYYNYRIERRHTLPNPIYKFFDWVLFLFYGYGVKPLRPLAGLVLLILVFGLLYPFLGVVGNSTWYAFNTSLIVSLSGTKLIDDPTHPATFILYWAFSIEKLLASLFFAMFLLSIGRTIIR